MPKQDKLTKEEKRVCTFSENGKCRLSVNDDFLKALNYPIKRLVQCNIDPEQSFCGLERKAKGLGFK